MIYFAFPKDRNKPGFLLKNPNKSCLYILKIDPFSKHLKEDFNSVSFTRASISPIKSPV